MGRPDAERDAGRFLVDPFRRRVPPRISGTKYRHTLATLRGGAFASSPQPVFRVTMSSMQDATVAAPGDNAIRASLARLLESPQFAAAPRASRFLRFIVEASLNDRRD